VSNVVDVTVYRLRRKIDGDRPDRLLHTVVGRGYVLRPERSA
jgi:DNA-binding response OmpR family regulator